MGRGGRLGRLSREDLERGDEGGAVEALGAALGELLLEPEHGVGEPVDDAGGKGGRATRSMPEATARTAVPAMPSRSTTTATARQRPAPVSMVLMRLLPVVGSGEEAFPRTQTIAAVSPVRVAKKRQ